MKVEINWSNPVIQASDVLLMQPIDLDDFYYRANNFDKSNLFFVLLVSLHHYLDQGDQERAAHLSFLIANYLFMTFIPPGSFDLALHYIKQAISLNPIDTYKEWLSIIEKGN
ncbi:MAG: hypothetical protein K2M15_09845 [Oscillospiraceae bacterium]|nr:hypothetical protein [Oscillospiraceae bacterium]MDE7171624.1 hypothetical protein [Oscillospiraceae bacterium]